MNEYGVVLYTDGGARPNPGYGGWGMHGYLYKHNPEIKKFTVNQRCYITDEGYLTTHVENKKNEIVERDMTDKPKIEIVKYINGYGSFNDTVSNNYTELVGAVNAIKTTTESLNPTIDGNIKKLTILCDSEYAVKAIQRDLSVLIKSDWKNSDGKEIKNRWILQNIHDAKTDLDNQKIDYNCKWVKGHNGDPGNEYADWNATTGVFLSTREHSDFNKVLIEDPKEYWKIDEDRHPLLFLRRCYFTSDTDLDKPVYIMGEHGDKNSFFMFPRSESVLSLVFLPTVNQTLKTVMEHQLKFLGGSENPKKKNLFISKTKFSIDMLSLYNREIQRSLKSFGTDQFYFKNANNIGLIHANKESIIDELNPQYLGFQFEDKVKNVEDLYGIVTDMIRGNKLNTKPDDKQECPEWIYITQDITDQFYQIVTEKYKHKPDPINTLIKKHFIERDTSSIDNIKSIKDKEKILEVYNTLTEEEKASFINDRKEKIKWIADNPTKEVCRLKTNASADIETKDNSITIKTKEYHKVTGLQYDENGIAKPFPIILNSNIDIPNRNVLLKLEEYEPKIYLLSWREDKVCKHCVMIKLNDDSSIILHNLYGNRLVLIDGLIS